MPDYMSVDSEELWEQIMLAYMEAGGDMLYPGDEKEMVLRVLQSMLINEAAKTESAIKMTTLRYAEGEYLDIVGENAHCERIQAAKATGKVKITMSATGQSEVIPAGSRLTADGLMYYTTDEAVTASGFAQTAIVGITCETAGEAGNNLTAGTMMQFADSFAVVESVEIYTATAGGNDQEDDETYRERIRLYGMANVTTGPAERYEAAAKAVSAEIIDVSALKIADGQVGVYLLLEDGADAAALIAAVKTALSDRTERPLTDLVTVAAAKENDYTLKVNYSISQTATGDVSGRVLAAVAAYTQWQDFTLGRAFDPDYLVALLYQAGAARISFAAGSVYNGGKVQYTAVDRDTRSKGTIQLIQAEGD